MYILNLVRTARFRNNLHLILSMLALSGITFNRYAQDGNIGRPNNLLSNKTKGPKQDSPPSAKVTYAWGRRTLVLLIITLFAYDVYYFKL